MSERTRVVGVVVGVGEGGHNGKQAWMEGVWREGGKEGAPAVTDPDPWPCIASANIQGRTASLTPPHPHSPPSIHTPPFPAPLSLAPPAAFISRGRSGPSSGGLEGGAG